MLGFWKTYRLTDYSERATSGVRSPLGSVAALALTALALSTVPNAAMAKKPPSDQDRARKEMRAGNQLSLREIERKILPMMRSAEYLGPAYDSVAKAYRLKFIHQGKVIFVDVDARTGRIIKRSE